MMTASDLQTLSAQIDRAMLRDRHPLRRRLRGLERAAEAGRDGAHGLAQVAAEVNRSVQRRQEREQGLPKPTYPEHLPVVERREEIREAVAKHQVVVLCGETG